MDPSSNYDDAQHEDDKQDDARDNEKWKEVFELVLYPMLKRRLLPQKIEKDGEQLFMKVASLPELYKVFERC